MDEFTITFHPIGKRGIASSDRNLMEIARESGIELNSVCGGAGTCSDCRIRVIKGQFSNPTSSEIQALDEISRMAGWRLACQTTALSDAEVYIPPESLSTPQRLQIDGFDSQVTPDADLRGSDSLGLAVDIGTTKIAAYLIDLTSGKTVAKSGAMNPQIAYGEDVVSRIHYAGSSPTRRRLLQELIIESVNDLVAQMCADSSVPVARVTKAVLVGNTVMHHLAAGFPVDQLGHAPFAPFTTEPVLLTASRLGLTIASDAQVYLPPVIAGYCGADHIAMLLGIDITNVCKGKENCHIIALDIGTNTEISLHSNGKLTCCTCASGPAFEGAHISEGMRAAPGAIERARWSNGRILYKVINDQPPVGICGSGILDIVAAMRDGNLITSSGKLSTGDRYELVPAEESGIGRSLWINRKDVNEIQLAKAAIRAGIEVLLASAGLASGNLDAVYIAGAFGTFLDIRSAIRIGMLPDIPVGKFHQMGNAAGVGAKQILVSASKQAEGERIAKEIRYLELANHKAFSEQYLDHLRFP